MAASKYEVMPAGGVPLPPPSLPVVVAAASTTAPSGGFLHSLTFKLIILIWYSIQNTVHILLMSYTRTRDVKEVYYPEVAAFVTELLKLAMCLVVMLAQAKGNPLTISRMISGQLLKQPLDTMKVGLPALLYTIQNIILYYAAGHLSATAFMITLQLKLMSAAIFSVLLLRRRLNVLHWISLTSLFVGVSIVQVTSAKNKHHTAAVGQQVPLLGFALTVAGCVTSGFSGVFLERIYKKGCETSIWMRNIQMSLFMIPISFVFVVIKVLSLCITGDINCLDTNYSKIAETRFLYGFDWIVWALVFWLSIGGLTVGICIKFADNITKDMATSMAIILATVASVMLFRFAPSWLFGFGAAMVIGAIFLYSYANRIVDAVDQATSFVGVMAPGPKRSHQRFTEHVEQRLRKQAGNKKRRSLSKVGTIRQLQITQWKECGKDGKKCGAGGGDASMIVGCNVCSVADPVCSPGVLETGGGGVYCNDKKIHHGVVVVDPHHHHHAESAPASKPPTTMLKTADSSASIVSATSSTSSSSCPEGRSTTSSSPSSASEDTEVTDDQLEERKSTSDGGGAHETQQTAAAAGGDAQEDDESGDQAMAESVAAAADGGFLSLKSVKKAEHTGGVVVEHVNEMLFEEKMNKTKSSGAEAANMMALNKTDAPRLRRTMETTVAVAADAHAQQSQKPPSTVDSVQRF